MALGGFFEGGASGEGRGDGRCGRRRRAMQETGYRSDAGTAVDNAAAAAAARCSLLLLLLLQEDPEPPLLRADEVR